MQVDIKTTDVVPIRQTFSHVARRIGGDKPASRYQEATFDLQPVTNFHYRPLWQPELELYDVRRTQIKMADWYALRDPRQYYYGAYTITRARQQEVTEKNFDFVDHRGLFSSLPETVKQKLIFALVPLRHAEWGANANNCYITAYGWGTAITQTTMFQAIDRLGLAQYLSRIGLLMDGNTGTSLATAKQLWLEHPAWQGLRRLIERLMVTRDWFELFVAQNLILDGLLHPLVQHYENHVLPESGHGLGLVTDFITNWYTETVRWVDAVIKVAANESEENKALLAAWAAHWHGAALEALQPYAQEVLGAESAMVLNAVDTGLAARLVKLGIASGEKG